MIIGFLSEPWGQDTVLTYHRNEDFGLDYFAIVMLGAPTRGMSVTVIWNKRYSNWNASRFQRASCPLVFTA